MISCVVFFVSRFETLFIRILFHSSYISHFIFQYHTITMWQHKWMNEWTKQKSVKSFQSSIKKQPVFLNCKNNHSFLHFAFARYSFRAFLIYQQWPHLSYFFWLFVAPRLLLFFRPFFLSFYIFGILRT